VPTDHNERSGPTIFGKRHTNVPFWSAVGFGFFAFFKRAWSAGVTATVVVVVAGTVVVVVLGTVVGVVVVVVVVEAATNLTGR
jgi:hypothetical protein